MEKNKKIILITEDEDALRNALHLKLESEGFSVLEAKNGEEGLIVALKEKPDLILVDIIMPKMDGITMIKKLKDDENGKNIKFIVVTNIEVLDEIGKSISLEKTINGDNFDYLIKSNSSLEDIVKKVKDRLEII